MINGDHLMLDLADERGREAAAGALPLIERTDPNLAQELKEALQAKAEDVHERSRLIIQADEFRTRVAETDQLRRNQLDAMKALALDSPEELQDALDLSSGCGGCP